MSRVARIGWGAGAVAVGMAALVYSCSYIALPGGWTVNFPGFSGAAIPASEVAQRLRAPAGFSVGEYATGIENARFLRFTPTGDLLVSAPRQGKIYLVFPDAKDTTRAGGGKILLAGLNQPHGLALHDGWLYVAETDAVLRVRFDAAARTATPPVERIVTGLPGGGNHWTRTIDIGPDGRLYVSIGSSCNVCVEDDHRRATIVTYALDGSDERVHATGLRNSVGFAWQPGTGDLYATDNGRDLLGDDFPPCELNRIVAGGFFGWPIANGNRVPDPNYGQGRADAIAASIPPAFGFAAHTAPLGIAFYDHRGPGSFPEPYRGAAFVALHGSWNRSKKIGYEVVALSWQPDGTITSSPFLTGFLDRENEKVYGRPVDVAVGPDGALYVSDDYGGSVYRVAYGGGPAPAVPAQAAGTRIGGPEDQASTTATGRGDPLGGLSTTERSGALARGGALWGGNDCARCHVASAAPGAAPETIRPLGGLASKYDIASLTTFLRTPQPPMPAYPLSDAERRDLAIYLLATYP